jgi:hypothetical protein
MSSPRILVYCLLASPCLLACGGSNPPSPSGSRDTAASGGASGRTTSSGGAGGGTAQASGAGGSGVGAGGADSSGAGGRWSTCLDTSSDPNHCGACGNKCGSVRLASGQSYPEAIAVTGGDVFWVSYGEAIGQGQLLKVPVAGGVPVLLASGHEFGRIAVDASSVYFTDGNAGTVMKVPIAGGPTTTLAVGQAGARAVAVDATHVYWTSYSSAGCPDDGGPCSPDGAIRRVPIGGGIVTTLASGQESPAGLAVDEQNVYWTSLGIRIQDGSVRKVARAGGTPTTLAADQWGVGADIAVGSGYVFWTGNSGGAETATVRKVPIDGGAVSVVVSGSSNGAGIAVDPWRIYWVSFDVSGGSVRSAPIEGGTPTVLADQVSPRGLAIDGTNVYWTESGSSGGVASLGANTCESGECRCPAGKMPCFGACVASGSCTPAAPTSSADGGGG